MLKWLSGLLGFVTGGFRTLWDDLINIIRSVDGYLENRINAVQNQVNAVIAGLWRLSFYLQNFINGPYANFVGWVQLRTGFIISALNFYVQSLRNDISDTRSWVSRLIAGAEALARALFGSFVKWVISAIFGPLSRDIATALGWIFNEGAFLFDIITHPEKLLRLILAFLFRSWVAFVIRFAPLIFAYGLRNWKRLMPVALTVIEDIITHVL